MSSCSTLPYKVVCFDMDGTLCTQKTNIFFAEKLGVEEKVHKIEEKLSNGKMESSEFMVIVSQIMKELSIDEVIKHFDSLPVLSGIAETVEYLEKCGVKTVIATTSNKFFADCFKNKYGFNETFGTVHEVHECGRIGIGTEVCSSRHKPMHIKKFCQMNGISMSEVAAVGDSLSDVYLFEEVGCSIAINYDQHLIGKADHYIRTDNMMDIIKFLGV